MPIVLLVIVDWMDAAQEQEIRVEGISVRSDVFERVLGRITR
jgi:hypothetical protein